jgi:alcohol dehydrogenase
MKAARYHAHDRPLEIEEVADPVLRPGAVTVRVTACFVSPTMASVMASPSPPPLPPAPFVPGMNVLGEVLEVAADVPGLKPGIPVFCDPLVRSTNPGAPDDSAFAGYFGFSAAARGILARWPDGGFAEQAIFPAEGVTALGAAVTAGPAILTRLGHLGTAYGAFARGSFAPGHTVAVTGATGVLGVSTVLLALAMGAGRVIAIGRRPETLERLVALDPTRVVAADYDSIPAGVDLVVDALGHVPTPAPTLAAIAALRQGGNAVLVGGVAGDLPLPYGSMIGREIGVIGSLWFERAAMAKVLGMIGSGQLDLSALQFDSYPIERANEAMAAAAAPGRPDGFTHVALVPA